MLKFRYSPKYLVDIFRRRQCRVTVVKNVFQYVRNTSYEFLKISIYCIYFILMFQSPVFHFFYSFLAFIFRFTYILYTTHCIYLNLGLILAFVVTFFRANMNSSAVCNQNLLFFCRTNRPQPPQNYHGTRF